MRERFFVINSKTQIMHIHGLCQHTKPRSIPIRLYDSIEELELSVGRKLRMCKACEKERE